jgi:hypothetical protein
MSGTRIDPSRTTREGAAGPRAPWLQTAAALPTATLHEAAGKTGALPWASNRSLPRGVVAIPGGEVSRVLDAAARREREEVAILERLAAGERTLDIYGWS